MKQELLARVEGQMSKALDRMESSDPNSEGYGQALDDLIRLGGLIDADRKSAAEVTKACTESDRAKTFDVIESAKVDIEKEKVLLEKGRLTLDENRLKADKTKTWVDAGVKGGEILAGLTLGASAIFADQKGLFVSKTGLQILKKI